MSGVLFVFGADMRIVFIGATEFSWHVLEELLELRADLAAVFTLRPSAAAGLIPDYRDLSELTMPRHIPCFGTDRIDVDENVQRLHWLKPDLILVMGLHLPLPEGFLQVPRLGLIKSFPSLVPDGPSHSAVSWAILTGAPSTGLSFCYMRSASEVGDLILQRSWPVSVDDSAASLYRRMVGAGREMTRELLAQLASGAVSARPVDAAPVFPSDPPARRIDWSLPARAVYDLVRASTHPFAGAFTSVEGRRLTVWKAHLSYEGRDALPGEVLACHESAVEIACGAGSLLLQIVQIGDGPDEPARRAFDRLGIRPGAHLDSSPALSSRS